MWRAIVIKSYDKGRQPKRPPAITLSVFLENKISEDVRLIIYEVQSNVPTLACFCSIIGN